MAKTHKVMISLNRDILKTIDEHIAKIGATRSGWVNVALDKQLRIEKGLPYMFKK